MGRLKKLGKAADDHTKNARVSAKVAAITLGPGAGPVADSYVVPPAPPIEHSQQMQRDEQKQYGDWTQLKAEQDAGRVPAMPTQSASKAAGTSPKAWRPDRTAHPSARPAQKKSSRPSR